MRPASIAAFTVFFGWFSTTSAADRDALFRCEGQDNGQPAPASFQLRSGDQEIAKGQCGRQFAIPTGSFELQIVLAEAIDRPTQRERLQVRPGQSVRSLAHFETGELTVLVTRDGQRSEGLVQLFRDGKPIASVGAGSTQRLSTGNYGIELSSRGEMRALPAVTIVRGELRAVVSDFAKVGGKSSQ